MCAVSRVGLSVGACTVLGRLVVGDGVPVYVLCAGAALVHILNKPLLPNILLTLMGKCKINASCVPTNKLLLLYSI